MAKNGMSSEKRNRYTNPKPNTRKILKTESAEHYNGGLGFRVYSLAYNALCNEDTKHFSPRHDPHPGQSSSSFQPYKSSKSICKVNVLYQCWIEFRTPGNFIPKPELSSLKPCTVHTLNLSSPAVVSESPG